MHALAQELWWGVDRIDAEVAHANGETGGDNSDGEGGAEIAILDTGIDSDHPDLQANIQGGKCFADDCCGQASGPFCSTNNNTCHYAWDDDNDHGTHCAGIADAVDNTEGVIGVSTDADLYAGKVLNGCGSGSYSNIAAGIEWAANQGYDVASMSLGGDASSVVKDACQKAHNQGVLLVAAAGNDGPCSDCVGYPAAYQEVIAISATTKDDSLAGYSSTGPEVELAAPGGASDGNDSTSIYSSIPGGYDYFNGTSMACPHVSGTGAQLMDNGSSNTEARSRLQNTAEDIGLSNNEQGYGLVDTAAALGFDSSDDLGGGGGGSCTGVDASKWPAGTGYNGYEYITQMDMDGQVVKSSSDNAYYDFACDDVIQVSQGGSFTVTMDFEDAGYNSHYGNVYVDWDQNEDWSTANGYDIMADVSDDTISYSRTIDVPSDAPTGTTLVRVRLSWSQFYGPTATDEYGEVNDFAIEVQ
jgi:subtilisin